MVSSMAIDDCSENSKNEVMFSLMFTSISTFRIYFNLFLNSILYYIDMFLIDFFLSVGLGLGGTDTPEVRSRKSISNERTFSATADEAFFYRKLGIWLLDVYFEFSFNWWHIQPGVLSLIILISNFYIILSHRFHLICRLIVLHPLLISRTPLIFHQSKLCLLLICRGTCRTSINRHEQRRSLWENINT